MYPNFGELMQLFIIPREALVVVLNCAELQIAFVKLGSERNTKRTVNLLVSFEVSSRIVFGPVTLVKRMIVQFGLARLVNKL